MAGASAATKPFCHAFYGERMGSIGIFVLGIIIGVILVPVLIIAACT